MGDNDRTLYRSSAPKKMLTAALVDDKIVRSRSSSSTCRWPIMLIKYLSLKINVYIRFPLFVYKSVSVFYMSLTGSFSFRPGCSSQLISSLQMNLYIPIYIQSPFTLASRKILLCLSRLVAPTHTLAVYNQRETDCRCLAVKAWKWNPLFSLSLPLCTRRYNREPIGWCCDTFNHGFLSFHRYCICTIPPPRTECTGSDGGPPVSSLAAGAVFHLFGDIQSCKQDGTQDGRPSFPIVPDGRLHPEGEQVLRASGIHLLPFLCIRRVCIKFHARLRLYN